MSERDQIATILNILRTRGSIHSWHFPEGKTVVIHMEGVTRIYTFLQFWSLFRAGEQAICSGVGSVA